MPAEFLPKVKKDFSAYQRFLKRKKTLERDTITLKQQKPQRRCDGGSQFEGGTKNRGRLEASVSILDRRNYSARIVAETFGTTPCFRFCSMGRAHVNREQGTGLRKRAIPTPHFHRVDKNGIMEAFQTPALTNTQSASLLRNYQSGINLFCQESKVISPDGGSVVVELDTEEMDLPNDDPLSNVNFRP